MGVEGGKWKAESRETSLSGDEYNIVWPAAAARVRVNAVFVGPGVVGVGRIRLLDQRGEASLCLSSSGQLCAELGLVLCYLLVNICRH